MLEDGWKWIGGGPMPSQEIEPSHQASVDSLEIRKATNCVSLMARFTAANGGTNVYELQDQACDNGNPWTICTIGYGSVGLGASIGKEIKLLKYRILSILTWYYHYVCICFSDKRLKHIIRHLSIHFLAAEPNYISGTFTCPMPSDAPPTDSLMILDTEQPEPMCKGAKAKYICDAGGVNVREVRIRSI